MVDKCFWKEILKSWQQVFSALSQFSRAEHFLHCRPFPPKPRGSSRHKGILGLSNQNLRLLRTFVGQKPSKKHEQSAAPKSVSTWPRPWFNLAPLSGKNCPHRCCCPPESQRSYEVHLPIIKYILRVQPHLFLFLPISKSSQPKLTKLHHPLDLPMVSLTIPYYTIPWYQHTISLSG